MLDGDWRGRARRRNGSLRGSHPDRRAERGPADRNPVGIGDSVVRAAHGAHRFDAHAALRRDRRADAGGSISRVFGSRPDVGRRECGADGRCRWHASDCLQVFRSRLFRDRTASSPVRSRLSSRSLPDAGRAAECAAAASRFSCALSLAATTFRSRFSCSSPDRAERSRLFSRDPRLLTDRLRHCDRSALCLDARREAADAHAIRGVRVVGCWLDDIRRKSRRRQLSGHLPGPQRVVERGDLQRESAVALAR